MFSQVIIDRDYLLAEFTEGTKKVARPILHVYTSLRHLNIFVIDELPQNVVPEKRSIESAKCDLLIRRHIEL